MSSLSNHEIPGRVTTFAGKGGLAAIRVESDFGTAEIYQHGAHVTCYCRKGETPILFLSESSDFLPDKPIRGGVPVIFPWFGAREGKVAKISGILFEIFGSWFARQSESRENIWKVGKISGI